MRPTTDAPVDPSHLFDRLEDVEREDEDEDEDLDQAEADKNPDDEDTGELYGVRTPHAADRGLAAPEDQDGFTESEQGETWLESLEHHAAESGTVPEEPVVVVDDSDVEHPEHRGHNPTERDRPVADKGSGGPGGR